MAPRTLASTWRQFEKLAQSYLSEGRATDGRQIRELAEKVNKSRIAEALETMFLVPYAGLDKTTIRFLEAGDGAYPDWDMRYEAADDVIEINPVGVVAFVLGCDEAFAKLATPEARRDFATYRLNAYMAELRKLPSRLLLFILVLRKVAEFLKVTEVEKRGGETEDVDDGGYMNLLWGFKEVERIYRDMKGINIRAEYGLLWYESDWYVGRN